MFKLTLLAFGLISVTTVASIDRCFAATNLPTIPRIAGNLSAQKLTPIKRSSPLGKTVIDRTVISTPPAKKPQSSAASKENQQMSDECRRELDARPLFSSNERPVPGIENQFKNGSFNNFDRGACNFSIPIIK
jgi:hypothetical protein